MAKLISLKGWVLTAIFMFVLVEIAASVALTWAMDSWPTLQQYSSGLAGFFTTRILALIVWGIIAFALMSWKFVWRLPIVGPWLSKSFFPVLHGEWQFVIESNWPIIEKLKDCAASQTEHFDVLSENTTPPSLSQFSFRTKISQSWFSTRVDFLGDEGSIIDHSLTLSVELLQETETDPKRVAWIYRQQNKQGAGNQLLLTDEAQFLGGAVMRVCEDGSLKGHYWTNRSWQKGLNAAGVITGNRITR